MPVEPARVAACSRISQLRALLIAFAAMAQTGSLMAQTDRPVDRDDAPAIMTLRGRQYDLYPDEVLRERGFNRPDLPPGQNAGWVYLDAYNARTELPEDIDELMFQASDGNWPEGEDGARLAAWLDQNQTALDLCRRAAAMSDCVMPVCGDPDESMIGILLPTLSEHRMLARMLAADAQRRKHEGRHEIAMENVLTIQRMGNHIAGGFTLIEYLVGVACSGLASRCATRLVEDADIDADVLAAASADLASAAESFPDWISGMEGERRLNELSVDDFMASGSLIQTLASQWPQNLIRGDADGWMKLVVRIRRLYLPDRTMKRHVDRFYNDMFASIQPAADGQPEQMTGDDDVFMKSIPAWNVYARIMMPSLTRSFELSTINRSNQLRAQVQLAVTAYERRNKRQAASLDELVPEFLPQVPIDPMTGNPLAYHPLARSSSTQGPVGLELLDRNAKPGLPAPPSPAGPAAAGGAAGPGDATGDEPYVAHRSGDPSPPMSEWGAYVARFTAHYKLTESQVAAAQAMRAELESRATQFDRANGARLTELRARVARTADAALRRQLAADLERLRAPRDKLFEELVRRLGSLPTSEQRRAAVAVTPD